MIETVSAERFDSEVMGGATLPLKMGCVRTNGERIDVFVKCSWAQLPDQGLVRELVGCLLAQAIGLTTGEPVLVKVPDVLVDQIEQIEPSIGQRLRGSVRPLFGSVFVGPGFGLCRPPLPENAHLIDTAGEIWVFDQLILNPDRSFRKPNCLIRGEKLVAIDHEKALLIQGEGFLFQPPWRDEWQPHREHLFDTVARSSPFSIDRLTSLWKALDQASVDAFLCQVPPNWNQEAASEIRDYLLRLSLKIEPSLSNLRKALT